MRNSYLFAALALAATSAHAEVTDTLDYDYYDVAANPNKKLGTLLNDASPFREGGRSFHAKTKWNVRWSYSLKKNASGDCKLGATEVILDTKISLPRLVGDSPEQQRQFAQYLIPLKKHELGHHQIAREAAAAVEEKLASLPGNPNCSELGKLANAAGKETVHRYNEKNRAYDDETDHGKSQGARVIN
jgi:predicted secreted Zn-dependent protease